MTWAVGMLQAVLDQHPSSGFILELLSSLSHVPPPISLFPKPGYIFLIILLPVLSGSPSPAITPDNCELSEATGSNLAAAPGKPLPPQTSPAFLTLLFLSCCTPALGKLAGLQAGKGDHHQGQSPQQELGSQAHTAPCSEGGLQLGRSFWERSAPVSRGETAVPKGCRLAARAALLGSCSHGHKQIPASPRKGIKRHHLALGELFPLPLVGRG